MKSHICYICLFSPKCVFSYVSLNDQHLKMHNCIVGICLAFPRCAFSYVLSNCLPEWLRSCTGCICKVFPHCVFSSELSNWLQSGMHNHRVGTFLSLHHCVLSNGPLKLHWLHLFIFFPIMYLHMFPHVNFIKACVDTLTAFVRPDFTMCFHMCPQIACLR